MKTISSRLKEFSEEAFKIYQNVSETFIKIQEDMNLLSQLEEEEKKALEKQSEIPIIKEKAKEEKACGGSLMHIEEEIKETDEELKKIEEEIANENEEKDGFKVPRKFTPRKKPKTTFGKLMKINCYDPKSKKKMKGYKLIFCIHGKYLKMGPYKDHAFANSVKNNLLGCFEQMEANGNEAAGLMEKFFISMRNEFEEKYPPLIIIKGKE